ncbi:hypothetical protein VNO78_26705 [Psophocarpus tetragonolobus]|uniref:RNA polymerase Rpb7-like N-terminal domain-containing protein n=1 Tax=Psophocarpus tetragonolobus TaxID=3891 RepID=A0AAN9S164_PSOTE
MRYRNSSVLTQSMTPRRSPRFLPTQNNTIPNPISAKRSVSTLESNVCAVGRRRSPRLNSENVEFVPLGRSPRFNNEPSDKPLRTPTVKGQEAETQDNHVVSEEGFGGGRKKERNRDRVDFVPLRRSPRFNNEPSDKPLRTPTVKGQEAETQDNHVVSEEGFGGGRKKERNRDRVDFVPLRRSPRFNNEPSNKQLRASIVKGHEVETKENRVVSDEGFGGGGKKETVEVETGEIRVVSDEGFGGGREKGGNGEKRKRSGKEIDTGWTKKQKLALERAYFSAKPSPHFWKNVSKQVPGKSQQECFDKIYCDFMTPPQSKRRSRAKTLKSSPIHQFSISASKLLKSIDKTVRRSNVLKPKNIITQKSIEKLLQRNSKADLHREGDIFSVLEPNIDFSTNALQPSEALSTPKLQKENMGFLLNCTETSSSSHKKSLSRFNGSCVTDLVSPPVLKKVKNRVMHEKYINQLRCREARRRAASRKITGERSKIQKGDAVKAAKVALVSEARDAINKFQQLQANFMGNTCTSDEDNDDGVEYEDESSMFYLSKIEHKLPLPPCLLPNREAIHMELEKLFLDKVIADLGLCIFVYDIRSIDSGLSSLVTRLQPIGYSFMGLF